MDKTCKNCKYLSQETDHLYTDYLKEQVKNNSIFFTCIAPMEHNFNSTWAFGLCAAPFDEPMCGGHYFEPKIVQTELFI